MVYQARQIIVLEEQPMEGNALGACMLYWIDLHVLGEEGGWHPLWGKAAPRCPRPPVHHAQPTSPASCLKRDLKFSSISSSESTFWMEKRGRACQGHPSLAPAWAAAGGRAGTTHQLCVTSPFSSVKWEPGPCSIPVQASVA